jgi:hypothetical protein
LSNKKNDYRQTKTFINDHLPVKIITDRVESNTNCSPIHSKEAKGGQQLMKFARKNGISLRPPASPVGVFPHHPGDRDFWQNSLFRRQFWHFIPAQFGKSFSVTHEHPTSSLGHA